MDCNPPLRKIGKVASIRNYFTSKMVWSINGGWRRTSKTRSFIFKTKIAAFKKILPMLPQKGIIEAKICSQIGTLPNWSSKRRRERSPRLGFQNRKFLGIRDPLCKPRKPQLSVKLGEICEGLSRNGYKCLIMMTACVAIMSVIIVQSPKIWFWKRR